MLILAADASRDPHSLQTAEGSLGHLKGRNGVTFGSLGWSLGAHSGRVGGHSEDWKGF